MAKRAPTPIPPLDILRFKLNTKFETANEIVEHSEGVGSGWLWPVVWLLQVGARWKTGQKLGEGGYGEVYLQQEQQTGELRAVKKVKLNSTGYKGPGDRHKVVERELRTMLELRDNHLFVKCLGWYEDTNSIYIAMEYMEGGDLSQYIKDDHESERMTEEKARQIIEQVLDGLVVLHKLKICHRDLKPKNILIADFDPLRIKLADFGSSKSMVNKTQSGNRGGTFGYMAPELLGYHMPKEVFDWTAVDMWALGCVVFEVMTGQTPFAVAAKATDSESFSCLHPEAYTLEANTKLFNAYCTGNAEFPEKTLKHRIPVSEWGVEFSQRCLAPEQWLRITSSEARMHRWITKRDELEDLMYKYGMGDISAMREALILAASSGRTKCLSNLLDKQGVDINAYANEPRVHGRTPLQVVVDEGHIEVVRYLLDRGADINLEAGEFGGRTALQTAAGRGHLNIVSLLLGRGADINARPAEFDGRTALQAAAGNGHIEVVELLLEKDAAINARAGYDHGRTALQAAAEGGHLRVVELLLSKRADVNGQPGDEYGRTALQAAAGRGHAGVVSCLLDNGADANAEPGGSGGLTALQAAAAEGYADVVRLLYINDANIDARAGENGGRTALQAAAGNGQTRMVMILLTIMDADIDAAGAQSNGRTALQAAAEGGHLDTVTLLLKRGAYVNARAVDYHGRTALQAAAGNGYTKIVSLLLSKGANVNAPAGHSNGRTALQAAAENGHMDIVRILLDRGANVNDEPGDIEGRTALQAAAGGGHLDIVLLLIEKGANVNASAGWGNGMTAFQAAANGGHGSILRVLFEKGANFKPKDETSSGRITLGISEITRMLRRPSLEGVL